MTSCTQERFLRDVRDHKLTITMDQGLNRHITLGRPGSSTYRYHITTWPGYLAISGDCGSYTFARLPDMFAFFRDESGQNQINESYWSEKLIAIDRCCDKTEVDEKAYIEAIRRDAITFMKDQNLSLSQAKNLVREMRWSDLFSPPSDESEAVRLACTFQCPETHFYPFCEFWDHRVTRASFRLVWCMRAIVWGIKQYDLTKQGRTQADHDKRVLCA